MAITKYSIVNMVHSLCELYCTVAVYLVFGQFFPQKGGLSGVSTLTKTQQMFQLVLLVSF